MSHVVIPIGLVHFGGNRGNTFNQVLQRYGFQGVKEELQKDVEACSLHVAQMDVELGTKTPIHGACFAPWSMFYVLIHSFIHCVAAYICFMS